MQDTEVEGNDVGKANIEDICCRETFSKEKTWRASHQEHKTYVFMLLDGMLIGKGTT